MKHQKLGLALPHEYNMNDRTKYEWMWLGENITRDPREKTPMDELPDHPEPDFPPGTYVVLGERIKDNIQIMKVVRTVTTGVAICVQVFDLKSPENVGQRVEVFQNHIVQAHVKDLCELRLRLDTFIREMVKDISGG